MKNSLSNIVVLLIIVQLLTGCFAVNPPQILDGQVYALHPGSTAYFTLKVLSGHLFGEVYQKDSLLFISFPVRDLGVAFYTLKNTAGGWLEFLGEAQGKASLMNINDWVKFYDENILKGGWNKIQIKDVPSWLVVELVSYHAVAFLGRTANMMVVPLTNQIIKNPLVIETVQE